MAAVCAACLQPIRSGTPFVLAGTEVFHRNASCASRIAQSVGWRTRVERDQLRIDVDEARGEIARTQHKLELTRDDRARAQEAQRRAETQLRTSDRRRQAAENDREMAIVERDRAMRELAIVRQFGQPAAVSAGSVTTPESTPAKDDRDASEVRFSLLELDKP